MDTTTGSQLRSASSDFSSSNSGSGLLSSTWPDLFATDRKLLQTQSTTECSTCTRLYHDFLSCRDWPLFNALSYVELQHHTSQHVQNHAQLTLIAEELRKFAIPQYVGTQHDDGSQSARLDQEHGYQNDFFMLGVDGDMKQSCDEGMTDTDININAEFEKLSDMGTHTSSSSNAGKSSRSITGTTQKVLDFPVSSLRPDDSLSKRGRWIAQAQATKNQSTELEFVEEASSSSSSLTSVSNISALNPVHDKPIKYPSSKRKADDTDIEIAAKQPKRAKLLEPFAFLKRNEEDKFVRGVRKKERVWRWLNSVEPRYVP